MKSLKSNSELLKRGMIVLFAVLFMVICIIEFCFSFEIYDDGYGTDISLDMDMIVYFLCGCSLLVYGIYSIYGYKKNKDLTLPYYASFSVIATLLTFYPLGVFFKALAKQKPFIENQEYLYIGILGLVLIAYLLFSYISDTKKKA